ncbi:hypothetical protein KHA93_02865 [Bacillus sp. FJAT-49732]|uniref:Phage protein n=1 Tax=Lederbergia citrisecunda TaxID=2833583 RepID=A0A942YJX8_9BACI|nr:hypothetical protein [Lederbergia citrisecunda]MBS4198589.1 hypothetical protein [Lederbergia citrisecunda]
MNQERELGWDDEIEKDGGDFILLPEGDYHFTVKKFERGRFAGSTKMPACNQAKLELTVHSPEHGEVTIFHTLLLHTKTEGFLSNFFTGIGQKKKGEKLRMNWNTVIGSKGKLKLKINKFIGRDNEERSNNEVQTFYPYEEAFQQGQGYQQQQPYQQPVQQQQPMQQTPFPTTQQQGGFTAGQF